MKDRRTSVPELLDDADLIELNVPLGPLRQGFVSGYAPAGSTAEAEFDELAPEELEDIGSGARILPHPSAHVPRGSLPLDVEPRRAPPPPPTGRHNLPDLTVPPPEQDLPGARPPQPLPQLSPLPSSQGSGDRRGVWIALVLLAAVGLGAALGFYVRNEREVVRVEALSPVVQEEPQAEPPAPEVAPPVEVQEEATVEEPEAVVETPQEAPRPARRVQEKATARKPAPKPVEEVAKVSAPEPQPTPVVEPEAPALPESLSRDQVKAGFETARAAVSDCAGGQYGVARVTATVTGSGRVTYALVSGDFQGTPAGSCMARAVRKAKFPKFSGEAFTVEYPYAFR